VCESVQRLWNISRNWISIPKPSVDRMSDKYFLRKRLDMKTSDVKRCFLAIAALASVSVSAHQGQEALPVVTPGDILHRIELQGAQQTVGYLWDQPSVWDAVTAKIASGRESWLAVAVALHPGSDAGASTGLRDAMFSALAKNPAGVLHHAEPEFPIAVLCAGRSDPLPTLGESKRELERVQAALEKLHNPRLQNSKATCLAGLKKARNNLYRFFGAPAE
jgi:hypothetical protein